ncbi:hypothetical protein PHYBLDRAFT_172076 [Phycomyces blakesleeanus NRRL 1555(-)]|uniref:Uncharacterized protein n=1 Tax=Phycomyces blakesleeanus (strain ATCC 8743b / DSM 1359 / FGSC 10004 / NBRC 33097 / NRRL 1555) TaxID=763407 RepID=A0A167L2G2_PHYB8|nr:hypothetical protein PHYBLDRAFT_172076 [Phycomyces blakesleeanus NRRL 1555(-)]OAD69437.1 hypothetical protein PHYBLDRAFT_172076 [Phycomyces blakesleeanus NRRL 1555(-)]|eukprot:XP_018287477.1 hypothetical protein PHYBLDRAFT_172076 [Phycomyces blakesleeanus NRRL 1555(-)]
MDINVTYPAYDMMDINDKASVDDSIDFDGFLAAATNNVEADEEDASPMEANSSNVEVKYTSENGPGFTCVRNQGMAQAEPEQTNIEYNQFVPMYTPNSSAEAVSLELFSLFFENSVSREIYNQSVKIVNEYMTERGSSKTDSLLSYYKVDTLLKQEYTVKAQVYDMCASRCFRFPDVEPGNSIVENETYQAVPLSEQLHFKLAHPEEQAKIAYGMEDILDGDGIHRLLAGGIFGQGDMVVSMFVDQFNPFKDAAMSASIIHVINMNINPAESIAKTMCFLESEGPAPMRDVGSICRAEGSRPGGGRYNAFAELLTLTSSAFFGQDEMHLIGHGTGHQLYQALGGKFCSGTAGLGRKSHGMHLQERLQRLEYPFALDVSLDDIEKAVSTSRADILTAFIGTWRSMKESNGKRKAVDWMDFLLFVVPTVVIDHLCFADAKQAFYRAIGRWHSFLRCKISDGKLKSNIFVMNQHMLVHLGFMLQEMGPLQAYSCHPIERTISAYTSAIKSRKEPGKNMENVLFWMAAISHCCGNRPARTGPADRRTSNIEVASDDVAGPQLWSSPTRYSMAELASTIGMEWENLIQQLLPFWAGEGVSSFEEQDSVVCTTKMWKDLVVYRVWSSFDSRHVRANNLVMLKHMWDYGFVCKFFSHTVKGVTRLFATTESLSDVRPFPDMLFPVSSNCSQSEMRIVDVKSFKGMAGFVHDTKDGAIRHIVWPSPTHNQ